MRRFTKMATTCLNFLLLLLLVEQPLLARATVTPTASYPHSLELRSNDEYTIFWKHDNESITFEIHAKTKGWVGLGLSPNGGMAGADIFIGWVKDGKPSYHDRHATGTSLPAIDAQQDWTVVSARETNTHTIFVVSRKLVSCDRHDLGIVEGTNRLIYAMGAVDPGESGDPSYHGRANRGTESLKLINPVQTASSLPDDVITFDLLNKNVSVPNSDTTYWCRIIELPKLASKHHVIRVEPMIQPGHEALVHHILVYGCYGREINESYVDHEARCFSPNMPDKLKQCNQQMFAWAIGGKSFDFPQHAGFPMGHADMPRFVRMETHYDNPQLRSDFVDSSGLRLHMTPSLRQHDAGIISAGMLVNPRHVIPPGFSRLVSTGHCTEQCLAESMGENTQEINVFGAMLHSHLLGVDITVRHIRSGVEQPIVAQEPYYDFNLQDMLAFPKEVKIKKGDRVQVDCTYNSASRTEYTTGGLATKDEMCLAFLLYYPAIPLAGCYSMPTFKQTMSFVGDGVYTSTPPYYTMTSGPYAGKNVLQVFGLLDWSDKGTREAFQKAISYGEIYPMCLKSSSLPSQSSGKVVQAPQIKTAYKPPGQCQDQTGGATWHVSSCLVFVAYLGSMYNLAVLV